MPKTREHSAQIVIIGAGPTGLTCGALLQSRGYAPLILEKSRGIGGRLATRRLDGAQFDHGAPFVQLKHPETRDWISDLAKAGSAMTATDDGAPDATFVGVPGMSRLCRPMADTLDIRFHTEITTMERVNELWHIKSAEEHFQAKTVIVAIPAPQALRILGHIAPVKRALASVSLTPCWTLMVQFESPLPQDWTPARPFAKVIHDSTKPGRTQGNCWVLHCTPDWSRDNLERDKDDVCAILLSSLKSQLGKPPDIRLAMAHRWRFAETQTPMGAPLLALPQEQLFIGGDWSIGDRAEHGVLSARALVDAAVQAMH